MIKVLVGKKIGMSQSFDMETARLTPVTVIDVSGNHISKFLKESDKVTHIEVGAGKKSNPTKADIGNYKAIDFVPRKKVAERVEEVGDLTEGAELKADVFAIGDVIDVEGITKGKGFAGVMKRWGFHGGKRTHGQSDRKRAPGSIGSGTTPGRVLKGKKMAGHLGNVKQTVKSLKVVDIDVENGLISVSGSVPGSKGSFVVIRESFFNTVKK